MEKWVPILVKQIKAFQRKVGLIPDGVAGTRTKAAMKSYTGC